MKLEEFTFVHRHIEESPISVLVDGIRKECEEIVPLLKKPKLKNHTTVFPPFFAPPDEMRFFACGMEIYEGLYGVAEGERNRAEAFKLDYFRNPGNDALILRLLFPDVHKSIVGRQRERMYRFSKWKFPLLGECYDPHICIAEGEGLYEKLEPHAGEIERFVTPIHFYLPPPEIMIKKGEGKNSFWERFDPLSGL